MSDSVKNQFKVGDEVTCIKRPINSSLATGAVYTIRNVYDDKVYVSGVWAHVSAFELKTSAPVANSPVIRSRYIHEVSLDGGQTWTEAKKETPTEPAKVSFFDGCQNSTSPDLGAYR